MTLGGSCMDGNEEEDSCQRIRSDLMFALLLLLALCLSNVSLKKRLLKNITVDSKLKSTQRCLVGSISARLWGLRMDDSALSRLLTAAYWSVLVLTKMIFRLYRTQVWSFNTRLCNVSVRCWDLFDVTLADEDADRKLFDVYDACWQFIDSLMKAASGHLKSGDFSWW